MKGEMSMAKKMRGSLSKTRTGKGRASRDHESRRLASKAQSGKRQVPKEPISGIKFSEQPTEKALGQLSEQQPEQTTENLPKQPVLRKIAPEKTLKETLKETGAEETTAVRRAPGARGNRTYRDRLFRMIFSNREDLLSLYNAVNYSGYTDPEELEITTLGDVLYLGMKNDVSFLIDDCMNLYEEQSTWNPNMPLRGLFYFSRLYSGYVEKNHLDIYSRARLALPVPRYVVFYTGGRREPDRQVLRLSASFEKKIGSREEAALECTATVLNIHRGHNEELMRHCRKLYEYSYLIHQIQSGLSLGLQLEAAIDRAIEDCIRHDILTDFLRKHRGEAKLVILTEYNEELHQKTLYHEGFEDGEKKGERTGELRGLKKGELLGLKKGEHQGKRLGMEAVNTLNQRLIQLGRLEDLKRAASEPEYQAGLLEEFGLTKL